MNYPHLPPTYQRCIAGDNCPLSEKCLRSLIWREPSDDDLNMSQLPIVNIHHALSHPCTEQCTFYRPIEQKQFARGMQHLYDNLLKPQYPQVRDEVIAVFPTKRMYYYCKAGEFPISPAQQAAILAIFDAHGCTTPGFDKYENLYDWA